MITWIRRRIALEDGVSLVETLFAIVVLTIALFGLMGTFIASAHSQLGQRHRSAGTRVATEHLESLRQEGHEALKARLPAGQYELTETTTTVVNGQPYTITTRLQEVDTPYETLPADPSVCPSPPTPTPPAGCPRHLRATTMHARTTVTWDVRGETRSLTSNTAIAAVKPSDARDILDISVDPVNPFVNGDGDPDPGRPTSNITVLTQLKGFFNSPQTSVRLSYWDDEGKKGPLTMNYDAAMTPGRWWKATIDRMNILRVLPAGEDIADLRVLIEVTDLSDGTHFSQTQTIELTRAPPPPSILNQSQSSHQIVSVPTITVNWKDVKVKGTVVARASHNNVEVRFSVSVIGLQFDPVTGAPLDRVGMIWINANNVYQGYSPYPEEPLTYNPNNGRWERTFVVDEASFQTGSAPDYLRPFYFYAVRADGVRSDYMRVDHPVKFG